MYDKELVRETIQLLEKTLEILLKRVSGITSVHDFLDTENGVILDGFPRTLEQAKELSNILAEKGKRVDLVPELKIPDEVIIQRIINRATCSNKECGAIYNLKYKPSKKEGICDYCGSKLSTRVDDNEQTVKQRLEVYYSNSKELINYYKNENVLYSICPPDPTADNASEIVVEQIIAHIQK